MPTSPTALPPGFRFHPTDEELVLHYLRKHAGGLPCPVSIIAEVDIYKFNPWDLPGKAIFGDREWYFFSPRERKYPNGVRPNRAAASGYWKATGTDKPIRGVAEGGREGIVGVKKALVFYKGRPPRGSKTTWIMHEYRLAQPHATTYRPFKRKDSMRLDDWVLCRIYKKTTQALPPVTVPSTSTDTLQQDDAVSPGVDADSYAPQCFQGTPAAWLPNPPSVSDFLADYPAVSALFDGLPEAAGPLTSGGSNDGGSLIQQYYTAEPQAADGSAQKIFLEDCNNATLQLHASTRSLHGASIAVSSLSMDHAFPDLG